MMTPMRRGLKLSMLRRGGTAEFDSMMTPMRRGLKLHGKDALIRGTPRFNDDPDAKGTETQSHDTRATQG